MKLQNLISIVLFFLSLPGNYTTQLTLNSSMMSPSISFVNFSALWDTNVRTLAVVDQAQLHNEVPAEMEAAVDTNVREPLPNSYYAIRFLTTDGTWRRHNGVAIQSNALLSSDHILPSDVKPEDVVQIQITNPNGDVQDVYIADGFLIQPEHGYTVIVFSENIIPEQNIALLGDADELNVGTLARQAVVIGADDGIYPTFIQDRFTAHAIDGQAYPALRVSPDKTIVGDSGDPLYIDGVVYGINNAGDGICGAITDPNAIYETVKMLTAGLNAQRANTTENMPASETPASNPSTDEIEIPTNDNPQSDNTNVPQRIIFSPKESGAQIEIIVD